MTLSHNLSEEEIDKIVEKAVDKAIEKLYVEVGKTVVKRGLWILGVAVVAIWMWLAGGVHLPK